MTKPFNWLSKAVLAAGLGLSLTGCASHTGNDALIGGGAGAALGAAVGSFSHQRAGAGALVGGALGALGGAIVGSEQDRQDHERNYAYDRPSYGPRDNYYEYRTYRYVPAPPPPPREYYEYRYRSYGPAYDDDYRR